MAASIGPEERNSVWRRYGARLGTVNRLATMGEGDTPLVPSRRIGPSLGCERLLFKLESLNPTGSYKDRFVALEIAAMLEGEQRVCVATSSGNTGSSLAAFSARYGIDCHIIVNEHTPQGKLHQMLSYGARIYRVHGFGVTAGGTLDTFERLKQLAEEKHHRLVVSAFRYSPQGMRGVKTLSYEISDALGTVDHVFVPVGGGGLITAVWQGFKDCAVNKPPRIHAVQPRGCATVVEALAAGRDHVRPVDVRTQISGLAVPFDIDGTRALSAVRESGGRGFAVTDEEIWEAQALLSRREGIYAEPAGAGALAGFRQALQQGRISRRETTVCVVTGHGFKDSASIARMNAGSSVPLIRLDQIGALDLG